MIEKLRQHFSFTTPASVHDEESLTALELAGRQGAKINEVVESQNKLYDDFDTHTENIENRVTTHENNVSEDMTEFKNSVNARTLNHENHVSGELTRFENNVIPDTVTSEVNKRITDGSFDASINNYAGDLRGELNTLLGSITEGSTTMDAEVIDGRVDYLGQGYNTIGEAIRTVTQANYKRHRNWVIGSTSGLTIVEADDFGGHISFSGHIFTANSYASVQSCSFTFTSLIENNLTGKSYYLIYDKNARTIELKLLSYLTPEDMTGDNFIIAVVMFNNKKKVEGVYACEDVKRKTKLNNELMYPFEIPECNYDEIYHNPTPMIFSKIMCIGDSYTSGHIEYGDGRFEPSNPQYSYPHYMSKILGTEVINCGVSGFRTSDFFPSTTDETALTRMQFIEDTFDQNYDGVDAYFVCVGLNDIANNTPKGTTTDTKEDESFSGVFNYFIAKAKKLTPNAKIFLIQIPGEYPQFEMAEGGVQADVSYTGYLKAISSQHDNVFVIGCGDFNNDPKLINNKVGNHLTALGYFHMAENIIANCQAYINGHLNDFLGLSDPLVLPTMSETCQSLYDGFGVNPAEYPYLTVWGQQNNLNVFFSKSYEYTKITAGLWNLTLPADSLSQLNIRVGDASNVEATTNTIVTYDAPNGLSNNGGKTLQIPTTCYLWTNIEVDDTPSSLYHPI